MIWGRLLLFHKCLARMHIRICVVCVTHITIKMYFCAVNICSRECAQACDSFCIIHVQCKLVAPFGNYSVCQKSVRFSTHAWLSQHFIDWPSAQQQRFISMRTFSPRCVNIVWFGVWLQKSQIAYRASPISSSKRHIHTHTTKKRLTSHTNT